MRNIAKRILCLFVCLFVTAGCLSETLISADKIVNNSTNYKLAPVTTGAFTKSGQGGLSLYFTKRYEIRYDGPAARYSETYVRKGDTVTKGQKLFSLTVEPDEVTLYEKRLELTRAREAREEKIKEYSEKLAEARRLLAQTTDSYAMKDAEYALEILKLEYKKYDLQSSRSISALEEALTELEEDSVTQYIYAPADGVIEEVTYFKASQRVNDGAYAGMMYDPDSYLLKFDNSNGYLRYNMEVTLSVGPNNSRIYGKGRVVALTGTTALINIESVDGELPRSLTRPMAEFTYIYVDGVTLIPRNAVTMYGGKYFVYKLGEDGMVSKRYVIFVNAGANQPAWVLLGAESGESLILN